MYNIHNLPVITLGSPYGIGYQIFLMSLKNKLFKKYFPICIGSLKILKLFINLLSLQNNYLVLNEDSITKINAVDGKYDFIIIDIDCCDNIDEIKSITDETDGQIALRSIQLSADLVKNNVFKSVVTLPVSKKNINIFDSSFTGHTEFFQKQWNENQVFMTFISRKFNVILLTTHLPLNEVVKHIDKALVSKSLIIANDLKNKLKLKKDICFLGVNPHAGENGLLGKEELWIKEIITDFNKNHGANIIGPVPADTAFTKTGLKKYSLFISGYHDQGLIPFKIFSFDDGVNLSYGMKYIRTSVDHGTGVDLIGNKNVNIKSFINAYKLAIKLCLNKS